ncbi:MULTISPECIES: YncE family protein [unclassified Rhodanobacter]|uniref:YncE family protein n=1 Tax=unclassified Rhodanobacter TaxID=2621553 RepID=UPI001BDDDE3E|nr:MULTISPECIES: YncE family protein [unclassified Rhodanobacter]MBT2143947.1 YncE family protein [Rhodanobacter sp. LX-99]MBT2146979.1 YncE family protein [Rhodanobacter sp. LX-100]
MPRPIRKLLPAALLALAAVPQVPAAAAPPPAPRLLSRLALGGPGGWDYLAFDAPSRHLFVSRGDRVLVIDIDAGKQIGTIAGTAGVHGIALADDLHRGFVSDGRSASVTVFDLASLKTVATITGTGRNPDAILYDSASHHVLAFNGKSASASVIDPAKSAVIGSVALPGKPEFAVADGAGHVYVNIEDKSELVQIDSASNKVLQTWPLAPCESPSGLAIDNAHRRLFAVCDNRTMAVLDAVDGHHVADVPIGDGPDGVVFDPAEAMIYSANGESGTITAVHEDDPDHYHVTATIPTQVSARTLTLDPKLHRLYLSAARLGATRQANGRRTIEPDSFGVLTVGRP